MKIERDSSGKTRVAKGDKSGLGGQYAPDSRALKNQMNAMSSISSELENNYSGVVLNGPELPDVAVNIDGVDYTPLGLIEAGFDEDRVRDAFTRLVGVKKLEPSDKQFKPRVKMMILEKQVDDKLEEIDAKTFSGFGANRAKKKYYVETFGAVQDLLDEGFRTKLEVEESERTLPVEPYSYGHSDRMKADFYGLDSGGPEFIGRTVESDALNAMRHRALKKGKSLLRTVMDEKEIRAGSLVRYVANNIEV